MDGIEEWSRAQERVIALVEELTDELLGRRVPACPDWTVRDLFSHMVGLGADVAAGDEPDDHNEEWTARQVERRRDDDVATLVAEWRAVTGPLRAWMLEHGARPLGDVIIHEQDLRGAVGVSGAKDAEGLAAIRDRFARRLAARLGEMPPIALIGEGWQWTSGGDPEDAHLVLRAPDFELARALVTRRSAGQLRSWTTRGDVGPYLDAFATLGPLPAADLTE